MRHTTLAIFGMTGSGKSGFAAYLLAAYARHPELGILIMDPQGQFASEVGLPFSLQEWAESLGRQVDVLSVSQDLRLRQNAPLLIELLQQTRFFRDLLVIRGQQPYESAVAEFTRVLQGQTGLAERRCHYGPSECAHEPGQRSGSDPTDLRTATRSAEVTDADQCHAY